MNSFVKFGVAALAATLSAGSAMAATAPHANVAHMRAHHHAKVAHAKSAHYKVAHRASGKIDRINARHNTLTINHRVYRLAPAMTSASFKAGQKVQITFRKGRGHRMIEKISAASA